MAHRTGCAALRHATSGNDRSWRFGNQQMHASDRYRIHGPILPMEQSCGLWARLRDALNSRRGR